jgi:aminoglycoside 6-adenylyltransferase
MKVDYTLATRDRVTDMARDGLDDLYQRGYQVLLDKENMTDALPPPSGAFPKRTPPSPEEFHAVVTEFWFEAAHIPRYLLRDELWVVKFRDWTMKELLLRMLEWHALTRGAKPVDVWHIGSHNQEWLDEQTVRDLCHIFGEYNAPSSWRALLATTQLFRRLTIETAAALAIAGADDTATQVSAHIATFEDRIR